MIRFKLLYAVLLVIMVLFFVLYRGRLSLELLIFAVLLPILLWAVTLRLKHSIRVSLRHGSGPALKGETFQWILQLQNSSILQTPFAEAAGEYSNSLTGECRPVTVRFPVMGRNAQQVAMRFHSMTCGVMTLHISEVVIYDPLRMFKQKIKLNARDSVLILPQTAPLISNDWTPRPQPDMDSAEFSKEKSGDDPSEIFDYHAYREGDAVTRIHWKLSSKMDTLMVKEYSLPLTADCILLPDYRQTCEQPLSALRLDTMLSALTAVIQQLSEQGLKFRLVQPSENGEAHKSESLDAADAAEYLHYLIQRQPLPQEAVHPFGEALAGLPAERLIVFTPHLERTMTEQLLSMPLAEEITVFAVVSEEEYEQDPVPALPFRCVPVVMPPPGEEAAPSAEGGEPA